MVLNQCVYYKDILPQYKGKDKKQKPEISLGHTHYSMEIIL